MFSSVRMHRAFLGSLTAAALTANLVGCGKPDEITSYPTPKEHPRSETSTGSGSAATAPESTTAGEDSPSVDSGGGPDRMLGAIVMRAPQSWFFKLTGPEASVTAAQEAYLNFLKTVEFTGPDQVPVWKLPEGWSEGPPKTMRFATLLIPAGGAQLELAISSLPNQGVDDDGYVLMNLNRWRGQLGLSSSTLDAMRSARGELETIELPGGHQAFVTNLRGKLSTGGMVAPFAR